MATTKLWHIKGRLKDLIDYVENPDKTVGERREIESILGLIHYVERPAATDQGRYVTAINCLKETALQQMIQTKQRFGKEDKYIAWHGYQSFKPGEVTPEICHEIGVRLAKKMWGDRFQIIVTTHLDKGHLHNHFCFNSVSFKDGRKYNYSKAEQQRFRDLSDKLCRDFGLSVIRNPHKAPSRQVWLDEKGGKPTRYNVYREDVREAIYNSHSPRIMEKFLQRKGYITDFTGKHWKIRLPQYEHFTRLDTLNENWQPHEIAQYMGGASSFGSIPARVDYPPQMPRELSDWYKPFQKTSQIYKLYLHYCYLLGILPKHTEYKPTSPYLKEDLRIFESLVRQTDYLAENHIETIEDLYADREKITAEIDSLTEERQKLQNKIRRADPETKESLQKEKAGVSARITDLRKRLKWNEAIEKRSAQIQDKTDLYFANEYRAREEQRRRSFERGRDAR